MAMAQTTDAPTFIIKRELKENAATDYKMEFTFKQVITSEMLGGEQDFSVVGSMKYSEKTAKYDAEKKLLDYNLLMSNMKFELGGFAEMLRGMLDQMPKEYKLTGTINDRNQPVFLKPDAKSAQLDLIMNMIGATWAQSLAYPETPVKIGDTWTVTWPKSQIFGGKEAKLTGKLKGEKTVNEVPALVILVDGTLPLSLQLNALAGGDGGDAESGQGATLSGPLLWHMEATVDKATGKVLEVVVKSSSTDLKIELSGQPPMPVKGENTIKLTPWKVDAPKTTN
jgi:hypothetical protein